jgi:hypothetical protein
LDIIAALLNLSGALTVAASLFSLHRNWRAKEKLYSTSLEGLMCSAGAGACFTAISLFEGAYIGVASAAFNTAVNLFIICLKLRWLLRRRMKWAC